MNEPAKPIDEAQARKGDAVVRLLEQMITDVRAGRLYGEFGVSLLRAETSVITKNRGESLTSNNSVG